MTAHTPGPWESTRRDDAHGNWMDICIEPATNYGGRRIARVENTDMQAKANARLIAAAPELLAALRELMNYTGGWDEPITHPCGQAAKVLKQFPPEGA